MLCVQAGCMIIYGCGGVFKMKVVSVLDIATRAKKSQHLDLSEEKKSAEKMFNMFNNVFNMFWLTSHYSTITGDPHCHCVKILSLHQAN